MSGVNFGRFDPGKLQNINVQYPKTQLGSLNRQQKVALGKKLGGAEKKGFGRAISSFFSRISKKTREDYHIKRADRYIQLRNRDVTVLGSGSSNANSREPLLGKADFEGVNWDELLKGINFKEGGGAFKIIDPGVDKNINKLEDLFNDVSSPIPPNETASTRESAPPNETTATKTTTTTTTASKVDTVVRPRVHSEAEKQKGASDAGKKHLMESLFQLNTVPDAPDQPINIHGRTFRPNTMSYLYRVNNDQKKELMAKHLPLDRASEISAQARKYPVMQAAVQEIRENLDKWDDLVLSDDQEALQDLKGKLEQQFQNLGALSEIISEAAGNPDDARALSALTPPLVLSDRPEMESLNAKFEHLIGKIGNGEANLADPEVKEFVGATLKSNVSRAKAELPKDPTLPELDARRKKAPVTTKAIQAQAQLHHAIRQGKGWAAGEPSISKQGTSANDVFKLRNPARTGDTEHAAFEATPGGVAAFFKVGAGGEEAAGVMEQMMWDIAVVMGLEEQFVPTGQTEVRDASQLTGGTEKAMQWNAEGGLDTVQGAQAPRRGGIQVAQRGQVLYEAMNQGTAGSIAKSEVAKGTVASVVFGMFDAHGGNIFVTEDGKIKYFDNTRSLPNSNGFINRGGGVVSSYRCSLLDLPQAHEKLTPEEINQLKQDVAAYKEKVGRLREYLNSSRAQGQLAKLPPGWMDLESSLDAMEERINLMEGALNSGKVTTLQELAEASNPTYRFAFALSFLEAASKGEISIHTPSDQVQQQMHSAVGYSHSEKDLSSLAHRGFDVEQIKQWCDDPNLTMGDVIKNLQQHYNSTVSKPPDVPERNRRIQRAEQLKAEMLNNAAVDYKDWDRGTCESYVEGENMQIFRNKSVPMTYIYPPGTTVASAARNARINGQDVLMVQDQTNGKTMVLYRTSYGYISKEVDMKSAPGKVKVDGKEVPIKEFVESLNERVRKTPTFDELPDLSPVENRALAIEQGLAFRKSQDGVSLVVGQRVSDGKGGTAVFEFKYPPGADGKFHVKNDEWGVDDDFDINMILIMHREAPPTIA